MVFKRNKKYFSSLKEEKEGYWVSEQPLFIGGNKGLFPVFKNGGPTGRFPKNHQEYICKDIPKHIFDGYNHKPVPNKTTKNILNFEEEKWNI
mgnify:CR=1 FL=1|tara:strand:- start:236 stop:511 length:276 start_codon:yes stop_codon:yes gene_type:complete